MRSQRNGTQDIELEIGIFAEMAQITPMQMRRRLSRNMLVGAHK